MSDETTKPSIRRSDETDIGDDDEEEVEGLDLDWRDVHDDFDPFQTGLLPSASPRTGARKATATTTMIVEELAIDDLSSVASDPFHLDRDDDVISSMQAHYGGVDDTGGSSNPFDHDGGRDATLIQEYNDDDASTEDEEVDVHEQEFATEEAEVEAKGEERYSSKAVEEYWNDIQNKSDENARDAEEGETYREEEEEGQGYGEAEEYPQTHEHNEQEQPAEYSVEAILDGQAETYEGQEYEEETEEHMQGYEREEQYDEGTKDDDDLAANEDPEENQEMTTAAGEEGNRLVGRQSNEEDSTMSETAQLVRSTSGASSGSSRRVSFATNSLVQTHPIRADDYEIGHEEDDDDDEESFMPPPPPSSPPPISDDEEEGSDEEEESSQEEGDSSLQSPQTRRRMEGPSPFEDVIYRAGNDRDGTPIVVFLPKDAGRIISRVCGRSQSDRVMKEENLIEYCVRMVGEVAAKGPYILIVATGGDFKELVPSRSHLGRLVEMQTKFPRSPHRKNLKKLIVLHPDPLSVSSLFVLKRFVSPKFWRKLSFVKRVSDLDSLLEPSALGGDHHVSLPLPEEILQFDIAGAVLVGGINNNNNRNSMGNSNNTRQARVRAESESANSSSLTTPTSFNNHWMITSSFGAPLAVLSGRSPFGLPSLVVRCVSYLCMHGIKVQGIFRVPGNADTVAEFKKRLDAGTDVDLGGLWSSSGRAATTEDVHVCAALLKMFFRDLPKPILTHAAYTAVIRASSQEGDTQKLARELKDICSLLPKPNRSLLQYISFFVQYLLQHERFNHMTAQNLAIVWVPNLIRDEIDADDPSKELRMLPHAMKAALTMFTHPGTVFPIEDGTILPPCFSMETGEQLPVEEVCIRDVTQPDLCTLPLPLDQREFDAIVPRKILPTTSFSLRAIVTDDDLLEEVTFSTPTAAAVAQQASSTASSPPFQTTEARDDVVEVPSSPSSSSGISSLKELQELSVRDLKRYLVVNGYDPSNCVEKSDLRRMARQCFAHLKGITLPPEHEWGDVKPLRRSSSFDLRQKRRSIELLAGDDTVPKRNSDLGIRDRRDSDMAFTSALKQAGMQVDELLVRSIRSSSSSSSPLVLPSKTAAAAAATATSGAAGGVAGTKRDFSQVVQNNKPASPTLSATNSGGGGLVASFLRRRSLLLTRENKRDLAKSAKGIGSGSTSSSQQPHLQSPSPPSAYNQSRLYSKRTSSTETGASQQTLEETARALKETPLFGEPVKPTSPNANPSSTVESSSASSSSAIANGDTDDSSAGWKLSDVDRMGIRDLKALIADHGESWRDCRTIEDLRERAKEVLVAAVVDPFYFSSKKTAAEASM